MDRKITLDPYTLNSFEVTINAVEGKDCEHYTEYRIEGSQYTIQVFKPEYALQYSKLMTVEEVMEELDKEHGL